MIFVTGAGGNEGRAVFDACLLLVLGCTPVVTACTSPLDLEPPADLPDHVWFRSATESFNTHWWVAVRAGRLWVAPNAETHDAGEWALLGPTGLPETPEPPAAITEVSADGCHLQAISDAGVFYRATDLRNDAQSLSWTDDWGGAMGWGPGLRTQFGTERGWSVSDSHPWDVATYTDIGQVDHSVGLGVAHVYRLGDEGRSVHFNDWWLPADWSRQICGPERGTVSAATISASASTLMLLGQDGTVYTRLYDLDTAGENDWLTYSYVAPDETARALPAQGWAVQPEVPGGRLSGRVAIAQDGQGNSARLLRVEAELDGVMGLWEKHLEDPDWVWVETGVEPPAEFLDDTASPAPVAAADLRLVGTLSRANLDAEVDIELMDFNLLCSPARVRVRVAGALATVAGAPLELELHHVHAMVDSVREVGWWHGGGTGPVRAALLLPEGTLDDIEDDDVRATLRALFGERRVVNFQGAAGTRELHLTEIHAFTMGFVPGDEKGWPDALFTLRVPG